MQIKSGQCIQYNAVSIWFCGIDSDMHLIILIDILIISGHCIEK